MAGSVGVPMFLKLLRSVPQPSASGDGSYLWGLGAFGQRGVERVVELLRSELALDMGMAGVARVSQIDRSFVRLRR